MPCSDPQALDRLYHYCSERAATDIVADEPPYFVSGGGSHHGWGMYATDIEPLDADSIAEVSTSCFAGEATAAELSHVLVVRGASEEQMLSSHIESARVDHRLRLAVGARVAGRSADRGLALGRPSLGLGSWLGWL